MSNYPHRMRKPITHFFIPFKRLLIGSFCLVLSFPCSLGWGGGGRISLVEISSCWHCNVSYSHPCKHDVWFTHPGNFDRSFSPALKKSAFDSTFLLWFMRLWTQSRIPLLCLPLCMGRVGEMRVEKILSTTELYFCRWNNLFPRGFEGLKHSQNALPFTHFCSLLQLLVLFFPRQQESSSQGLDPMSLDVLRAVCKRSEFTSSWHHRSHFRACCPHLKGRPVWPWFAARLKLSPEWE